MWSQKIRILDAYWTPRVNILAIECGCGKRSRHPANIRWFRCKCGNRVDTLKLKAEGR